MKTRHYTYKNSIVEMIVELVILLLVIGTIIYTLLTFSRLPNIVATHIGVSGKVDDFGNKSTLLILPIVGLLSYIGLTILQRYPHIFNYPIKVTEENIDSLYSLGIKMVRCLKLFVILIFAAGTYIFSESALGKGITVGITIVVILLVLMNVMLVYYIVKMSKQK